MRGERSSSSSSSSSSNSSLNDEELAEVLRQVAAARYSHLHLHSPGKPIHNYSAAVLGIPSPQPADGHPPQPTPLADSHRHVDSYQSVRPRFTTQSKDAADRTRDAPESGATTKHDDAIFRVKSAVIARKQVLDEKKARGKINSAAGQAALRHEAVSYRRGGASRDPSPNPLMKAHDAWPTTGDVNYCSNVSTSQAGRGADRGLVVAADGFVAPEELRRRREERLERARQLARREETFRPNASRQLSPAGTSEISGTGRSISRASTRRNWQARLHDESVSHRRQRQQEYEAAQKSAALAAELAEAFQHCTFRPATAAIHAEKRNLKRDQVHAQFSGSSDSAKADACERLFAAAKSNNPKSTLELHREFMARREEEEEARRQRVANAAPAPVHLRLFEIAQEKAQAAQQPTLVTSEATITYPIKNQWYTITPTQHADPESFERLHSDGARREAAHRELKERHKAPFAPTITQYAASMHHRGGADAFTRLASTAGNRKPQASSSKATLAPVSSVVVLSRQMSRVVTPDRDPPLRPEGNLLPPPFSM